MTTIASQITSLTVVYSTVCSDADKKNHQSSASLAFVWGIHRDRWIPRTKGQLRGKCFHLMTSSCIRDCDRSLQSGCVIGRPSMTRFCLQCGIENLGHTLNSQEVPNMSSSYLSFTVSLVSILGKWPCFVHCANFKTVRLFKALI